MGALLQQAFTLSGVLFGAGATFAATTLTERSKWRRGQVVRWDERRLAAYTEYANALKAYVQVAHGLGAARGYPSATQPIPPETGREQLARAEADRAVKWETVLLLGSPPVVAAAREWHDAVWEFGYVARGRSISHDEYRELIETMGRRRDEFYRCARADLGVSSGEHAPGDRVRHRPDDIDLASSAT